MYGKNRNKRAHKLIMKKLIRYSLIIIAILAGIESYACICTKHTIKEDIDIADEVFLGTVDLHSFDDGQKYTFSVLKIYKGNIALNDKIVITQGLTSCTRGQFSSRETYLIFAKNRSVSQCNNSGRFENNPFVPYLDSVFQGKAITSYTALSILEEIRNRFNDYVVLFNLDMTGNNILNIKNKKAVFWNGKKMMYKSQVKESDSDFYPTRYYLEAEASKSEWLKELGVDYFIFVSNSHKNMTRLSGWMNKKMPSRKGLKKLKRFLQ